MPRFHNTYLPRRETEPESRWTPRRKGCPEQDLVRQLGIPKPFQRPTTRRERPLCRNLFAVDRQPIACMHNRKSMCPANPAVNGITARRYLLVVKRDTFVSEMPVVQTCFSHAEKRSILVHHHHNHQLHHHQQGRIMPTASLQAEMVFFPARYLSQPAYCIRDLSRLHASPPTIFPPPQMYITIKRAGGKCVRDPCPHEVKFRAGTIAGRKCSTTRVPGRGLPDPGDDVS